MFCLVPGEGARAPVACPARGESANFDAEIEPLQGPQGPQGAEMPLEGVFKSDEFFSDEEEPLEGLVSGSWGETDEGGGQALDQEAVPDVYR